MQKPLIGIAAPALARNHIRERLYKQITGKSIFEDLIAFRIEKAKQLLSETALSLTEIASACGYTSESYFMRQFKQISGLTPSQYREQMKAKK